MKTSHNEVILEGKSVNLELDFFDRSDFSVLSKIYKQWVELSNAIQKYGGRRINIPELLSEAIFCIHFNAGRMRKGNSKINTSFDCLIFNPIKRIQVKSCSVSEDLTSFGPTSIWDELYLVHFFPNKKYDGRYKIYLIDNEKIFNHKVNANETFIDQQRLKRRPRFSLMKEIIVPQKLRPVIDDSLF